MEVRHLRQVPLCNINLPGAKNSDLPISISASIAGNERDLNDLDTLGNHMYVATSLRLCHNSYKEQRDWAIFMTVCTSNEVANFRPANKLVSSLAQGLLWLGEEWF